jgi:mono/diheme cytochrome c family protein
MNAAMQRAACLAALVLLAGSAAQAAPPAVPRQAPGFSATMFSFDERSGEELFQHVCQACHMPDAKGAAGAAAYPALAGNPRLASKAYVLTTVVNGRKAMPAFGTFMDDRQVAAVADYVRSHFGNDYADQATPAEVHKLRPKKVSPASFEE